MEDPPETPTIKIAKEDNRRNSSLNGLPNKEEAMAPLTNSMQDKQTGMPLML